MCTYMGYTYICVYVCVHTYTYIKFHHSCVKLFELSNKLFELSNSDNNK